MTQKIYNNGFKKYYYICNHCGSESVDEIATGGFSPPNIVCCNCNRRVLNNPITIRNYDKN
jgi:hypothetical protein